MERDPNGVAAAVSAVVFVIAGAIGATVDAGTVDVIAGGVAALVSLAAIVLARRKAWAPDTVRALQPQEVPTSVVQLPAVPAQAAIDAATHARRAAA